jgi:hypothetical protein
MITSIIVFNILGMIYTYWLARQKGKSVYWAILGSIIIWPVTMLVCVFSPNWSPEKQEYKPGFFDPE